MRRFDRGGSRGDDVWDRIKWNGWGAKNKYFELNENGVITLSTTGLEYPNLLPFIKEVVDTDDVEETPSVDIDEIKLRKPTKNENFMKAITSALSANQISSEDTQRICHTYGRSHRDLWRARRGIFTTPPDVVIFPQSTEDVEKIIKAANEFNACIIPYGGGTNIVGAVEPEESEGRMLVSLDMRRMNKLLWLDKESKTACFEAGVLGPDLEAILAREGYSLGHDPDSFEWSTLGGWLATCSSGMQSDKYGDIEDMCLSLKVVTPSGTIVTPPVPRNGAGLSLKHLFIGSEGILGIITEAIMRVHKLPEIKEFHGLLFKDWEHGIKAIQEIVESEAQPAMIRLYDDEETKLSFSMKPKANPLQHTFSVMIKKYLETVRNYQIDKLTLMIVGFEGYTKNVTHQKKMVFKITKKHEGFWLGQGPGKSWFEKRYDLPLMRDFLLGHGMWVDVAETATTWPNVLSVWKETKAAITNAATSLGCRIWAGCHISHSYKTGCCLYFHFASLQLEENEDLELYLDVKKAATEAILKNGGALSHHHGIGFEHVPFVGKYFDKTALKALRELKKGLDPKNICNPGKVLPDEGKEEIDNPEHSFWKKGIVETRNTENNNSNNVNKSKSKL